jgi:hypothetical protein
MTATPSQFTSLGIGAEATEGTAADPALWLPVTAIANEDKQDFIEDTGMRGSMVKAYGHAAGVASSVIDFGGQVDLSAFPVVLAGVLGDVTTTGEDPYTHAISVLNEMPGQPSTYTVVDGSGVTTRRYTGVRFGEVAIKAGADKEVTYTAKGAGFPGETVSMPTVSYLEAPIVPAWTGTCTIGSLASVLVEELDLSVKRGGADPIHVINGTRGPVTIYTDELDVTCKAKVVMDNTDILDAYLAAESVAVTFGFATAGGEIVFQMSTATLTAAKVSRGQKYVSIDVDLATAANTIDAGASGGYSPIKVTVANAVEGGTYA